MPIPFLIALGFHIPDKNPIATESQKKTQYKYLGKAGTKTHINVVKKMSLRNIIDELERVVHSLPGSYFDICFGGEI